MWGCLKTRPFKWCFRTLWNFLLSFSQAPGCWLHTVIKELILCSLCGTSAYNHQIYMCLFFRETLVSAKLEWCHGMCKAYSVFAGTDMESNHRIESTEQWHIVILQITKPLILGLTKYQIWILERSPFIAIHRHSSPQTGPPNGVGRTSMGNPWASWASPTDLRAPAQWGPLWDPVPPTCSASRVGLPQPARPGQCGSPIWEMIKAIGSGKKKRVDGQVYYIIYIL